LYGNAVEIMLDSPSFNAVIDWAFSSALDVLLLAATAPLVQWTSL
jgi:hypothetical protein